MHISEDQLKYITNANAGDGLAKIGKALVPFQNQMSKGTEIYQLMSTKPEDFDGTWHNAVSTKGNGGKTDECDTLSFKGAQTILSGDVREEQIQGLQPSVLFLLRWNF